MVYSIQMLRAVAASLVALFHSVFFLKPYLTPEAAAWVEPATFGMAGVDIFFVISGFVIVFASADMVGRVGAPLAFLWHRMCRIYPTYWILAIASLPLIWAGGRELPETFEAVLRSLALLPGSERDIILVAWTLVFELYFYIVFAALVILPRGMSVLCLSAVLLGGIAARKLGLLSGSWSALVGNALLVEFMLGAWIGWIALRWPRLPVWLGYSACALGLAGFAYGGVVGMDAAHRVILWGVPSAFLVFGLVILDQGTFRRGFARFIVLGDASYALYLLHWNLFLAVIPWLFDGVSVTPGLLALWCVISVSTATGLAVLFNRKIERPVARLLKGVGKRTLPRPPRSAAQP